MPSKALAGGTVYGGLSVIDSLPGLRHEKKVGNLLQYGAHHEIQEHPGSG